MRSLTVASSFCFLIAICGCGSGGLAPVKGKVMNGSKPLTQGHVVFHPDASQGNESQAEPRGEIKSDGTYTIRTRTDEGVAPGWYKVTVIAQKEADQANPGPPVYFVQRQYVAVETTPLTVEVKENPPEGHYDLNLKPFQ